MTLDIALKKTKTPSLPTALAETTAHSSSSSTLPHPSLSSPLISKASAYRHCAAMCLWVNCDWEDMWKMRSAMIQCNLTMMTLEHIKKNRVTSQTTLTLWLTPCFFGRDLAWIYHLMWKWHQFVSFITLHSSQITETHKKGNKYLKHNSFNSCTLFFKQLINLIV